MSTGFCSTGTARPWRRLWRGLPATAIAVKTSTLSTASGGCGRSMGGFVFSRFELKPRKWRPRNTGGRGEHRGFHHIGALLTHMRMEWLLKHFPPRLMWACYVCANGFITIGLLGLLALLTGSPFVFPS